LKKKPCLLEITKKGLKELMPFTDVSLCSLTKQRLLKALEATVKVYENRQQRIATSKFNEYMLKVIEAYPPPATKGIKIKYCMQLPTPTPQFVFCQYATICKRTLQTLP
jgi:GTP-binding protein